MHPGLEDEKAQVPGATLPRKREREDRMSINSIASNLTTQNLIQRTMAAADVDGNGQLSKDEFSSFFTTLLEGLAGKTSAGSAVNANVTAADEPLVFAPVPGFDTGKINDPLKNNEKYTPALRVFSRGLAALGLDAAVSRGNLQPLVDYAKQRGFPNAKTVSDDKIDFGDGRGGIDVITAGGTWWFQNQP